MFYCELCATRYGLAFSGPTFRARCGGCDRMKRCVRQTETEVPDHLTEIDADVIEQKNVPPKSIQEWLEILASTKHVPGSPEIAMANRILDELTGYRPNSAARSRDAQDLAGALLAYAKTLEKDWDDFVRAAQKHVLIPNKKA